MLCGGPAQATTARTLRHARRRGLQLSSQTHYVLAVAGRNRQQPCRGHAAALVPANLTRQQARRTCGVRKDLGTCD